MRKTQKSTLSVCVCDAGNRWGSMHFNDSVQGNPLEDKTQADVQCKLTLTPNYNILVAFTHAQIPKP